MDDQDRASRLTRAALTGCGLLVLLLAARSAVGDVGVQVVLLVAMLAVTAFAYGELTGRPVPLPRRRVVAAAPVGEDPWRSERWIADAVERGLRELEQWRLEQHEA